MALTRVRIEPEVGDPIQAKGDVRVFFNPNQYSLAKKVSWKEVPNPGFDLPGIQFDRGEPRNLALSLLFDTYEDRTDVRDLTKAIATLTEVAEGKDRPPFLRIFWGKEVPKEVGLPFTGVLDSLTQKFTLFLDDGTPVRATLDLSIREVESPEKQLKRKKRKRGSPIQARSRVVRQGDSLWSIAATEYGDPRKWRPIAKANAIRNPRVVQTGTTLLIPSID